MELLSRIREEIDFQRKRRAEEKEIEKLERKFNSPKGREYLTKTLQEHDITRLRNEGARRIGKDRQAVFVVDVNEEVFLKVAESTKPKIISYEERVRRDEYTTGDFYIEVCDKIAIRAIGKIDDLSGAETLFSKLWALSYRHKENPTYEQPWGKLFLQIILSE